MSDYDRLSQMGCKLQLNLPSIVGFYGSSALERSKALLKKAGISEKRHDAIMKLADISDVKLNDKGEVVTPATTPKWDFTGYPKAK